MIKLHRLQEVLCANKQLILTQIEENKYHNFINKVMDAYIELLEDDDKNMMNEEHIPFGIASLALFRTLHEDYFMDKKQSVELIYTITFKSTEKIFDDLSFVQMAYYLICNKPFLKQLILRSLSEFHPTDMEDIIDEQALDPVLEKDLQDSNIGEYFIKRKAPELVLLLKKADNIIEEFVDKHFTKHQKNFSLEDFL